MHEKLRTSLPIDDFFVCYHDDADACDCRKPKPGLLLQAAVRYQLDLANCYLIGDRWRDIEAGHAAGCVTVWIDRAYAERNSSQFATVRVASCAEAADWILQQDGCNRQNIGS
jgi:D-glycero-D-manno-heptose 1,7-bisphosphate phosphatase